jgi:RNA polymerase sigma factor (sigma-70 family)
MDFLLSTSSLKETIIFTTTKDRTTKEFHAGIERLLEFSTVQSFIDSKTDHFYGRYGMEMMGPVYRDLSREDFRSFVIEAFTLAARRVEPEILADCDHVVSRFFAYTSCVVKEQVIPFLLERAKDFYPDLTAHELRQYVRIRRYSDYLADLSQSNHEINEILAAKGQEKISEKTLDSIRFGFGLESGREEENSIPSVEEGMLSQETAGRLHDALGGLKPEERQVIVARYFEQQTYKQIAAAFGMTSQAIMYREKIALGKLRAAVA